MVWGFFLRGEGGVVVVVVGGGGVWESYGGR